MSNPTIDQNGTKFWRNVDGKFHREDGPAAEYTNGGKAWLIDGKFHRENGPAVEYSNGDKEWWVYDEKLTKQQFDTYTESLDNILNIDYG